jgi:hypothetical protein
MTTQHNTTQQPTTTQGLVDSLTAPDGLIPVLPVGRVRRSETQWQRGVWSLFAHFAGSTSRRRQQYSCNVPAELLEPRQLLTDPMAEMNEKLFQAVLMSNDKIDSFFGGASGPITGELNGALGEASAKFNTTPLNGSEIEDETVEQISTAFGTVESRVSSAMTGIADGKPVIGFPKSFEIGTPYVMFPMIPMPGMQFGNHGYFYVNPVNGDFSASSNWVYEVPSSVPGVMQTRLVLAGTMSRTAGNDVFDLHATLNTSTEDGSKSCTIDFDRTGTGSAATETLYFHGSSTAGPITTNAMGHMQNGVFDTWSFGGSANLGDVQAQFSKSHMYQTDRLFGSIDYLAGNTRASARFRQVNSTMSSEAVFSYQSAADKYLQVGAGQVHGVDQSGQDVHDQYGRILLSLPVKRLGPWLPSHVIVSKSWHNSTTSGGDPALTFTPPELGEGTLFIMHEGLKNEIFSHDDMFWIQYGWSY